MKKNCRFWSTCLIGALILSGCAGTPPANQQESIGQNENDIPAGSQSEETPENNQEESTFSDPFESTDSSANGTDWQAGRYEVKKPLEGFSQFKDGKGCGVIMHTYSKGDPVDIVKFVSEGNSTWAQTKDNLWICTSDTGGTYLFSWTAEDEEHHSMMDRIGGIWYGNQAEWIFRDDEVEVILDDSNGTRSGERDSVSWSMRNDHSINFDTVILNLTFLPDGDLLLEDDQGIQTIRLRRNIPDPGDYILTSDLEGYAKPDFTPDPGITIRFSKGDTVLFYAFTVDNDGNLWGFPLITGTYTPDQWLLCQEANGKWNICEK